MNLFERWLKNSLRHPETSEDDSEPVRYWADPLNESGLLRAMMEALAGDAHISFEGDLSRCDFPEHLRQLDDETEALLRRQCIWPTLGYAVLRLNPDTVEPILEAILPEQRYLKDIIHIQIGRHDKLLFGSYDNFHRECVVCYEGVEPALLDELKSADVIRSWQIAPADKRRWHD